MIPFDVRKGLEEVHFEHPRRRYKEPMWRVYYLHVFFFIKFPYLRHERLFRINDSTDFFAEGSYDHGVGHH